MTTYLNISGYKFFDYFNFMHHQKKLKQFCKANQLVGTILLSPEGININLAGLAENIEQFKVYVHSKDFNFSQIDFKETVSQFLPFKKLVVKEKKEIIKFVPTDSIAEKNNHLSPSVLKQWLDEKKEIILLDTRNKYETELGTFKDALTLDIQCFTELPEAVSKILPKEKVPPVVMFCTGGIRCEKVLPLLQKKGYESLYQLEGGILNYFAQCKGAYYEGDCFVFDDRVSLNAELKPSGTVLCIKCQKAVVPNQENVKAICSACQ